MKLQQITEQDEIKKGDVLIDKNPVTQQEIRITVSKVTKTRIITNWGTEFTRDGCSPNDKLMRWRIRLFKAVEE